MLTCVTERARMARFEIERRSAATGLAAPRLGLWSCGVLAVLLAVLPAAAPAQRARTLTACTSVTFTACAELRLTAGPDAFELALRAIGDPADATRPVAFYNLVLGTGAPSAAGPRSTLLPPAGASGATVSDSADWEVFDSGDALFLSALSNRGVGACAAGADVGGFGQAVATCGVGQFAVFRFAPTALFDPDRFRILDLEAVTLIAGLPAASCGAPGAPCVITADTTVPEPTCAALLALGGVITGLVCGGARHRAEPAS